MTLALARLFSDLERLYLANDPPPDPLLDPLLDPPLEPPLEPPRDPPLFLDIKNVFLMVMVSYMGLRIKECKYDGRTMGWRGDWEKCMNNVLVGVGISCLNRIFWI